MSPRVALASVVALAACVEPYRTADVRPVPPLARTGPRPLSVQQAQERVRDEVAALRRAAVTLAWHVREALPAGCDVESVASAEALVVARCPSDQLFAPGYYSFHRGATSAAWTAVGAWIGRTLDLPEVGSIDVDVTGSVDDMYCCHEGFDGARRLLGASGVLHGVSVGSCLRCPGPPRDRSTHADCNRCLSLARGVAVAESLWPTHPPGRPGVRVRARGAGTCWLEARVASVGSRACRRPDDCAQARRVDVTMRLHPPERRCSILMIDPASTLYCYQEAWRQRASEATVGIVPSPAPPPARSCANGVEGVEQAAGSWNALPGGGVLDLADGFFLPAP